MKKTKNKYIVDLKKGFVYVRCGRKVTSDKEKGTDFLAQLPFVDCAQGSGCLQEGLDGARLGHGSRCLDRVF